MADRRTALFCRAMLAGALVAGVALGASGCALGKNYRRPDVAVPETTRGQAGPAEAATMADLGWWEVFGDPELQRLLEEALAANHDLEAAAARVEQARSLVTIARADMLPQLDYTGDAARQRSETGSGKSTFNSFLGAVNLAWEIDLWGRIRRQTEAATAGFYQAEDVQRGVLLSLLGDVATAYYELVGLDLELDVTRSVAQTFRETRDLFHHRFEGGIGTMLEVSRARAALAGVESQIPEIERRIVQKENQLCVLLGRIPGPVGRRRDLVRPSLAARIPVGLPSELLERRPDLLEAEHRIVAANAEAGAALASFFPRFGLTSLYGGQSAELEDIVKHGSSVWAVGGTLTGPLFQGGRLLGAYRVRSAELDEAVARYEQATLRAFAEVSTLLVAHEKLGLARERRGDNVEQLRMSVDLSLQRYRDGVSSYFEVLEAQQQFFPSQIELVRLQREEIVTLVDLYRALGGGWKL